MTYNKYSPFMKWWKILIIDVLCLGVLLVTYAYFHHVRAREVTDFKPTPTKVESNVSSTPSQELSQEPSQEISGDESGSLPDYSYLQLGEKFYEKFCLDGGVIETDGRYVTDRVSVELKDYTFANSSIHVCDIYICNVEFFRTEFSQGKFAYGSKYLERTGSLTSRLNAICATNGDYYAAHTRSFIVRNGIMYDDSKADDDICVLFYDGTMIAYHEDDFNSNRAEIMNSHGGIWQTWGFGPKLLNDGNAYGNEHKFNSSVNPKNPRTVIGYYEPGHYCLVTVDGRTDDSKGCTLHQLSAFMASIGCTDAFNVDGGMTSVMTYNGEKVNTTENNKRYCSDAIYIAKSLDEE